MNVTGDYHLIERPPSLKPLDSTFQWHSRFVDYTRHPAYADFVKSASLIDKLGALSRWTTRFTLLLVKRLIKFELISSEFRKGRTVRRRLGFLKRALLNTTRLAARPAVTKTSSPAADDLARQGVAVVVMPPQRLAEINEAARELFETLELRRGAKASGREFEESRANADRDGAPELFALIDDILRDSGLLEAVRTYLGREAQLIDINPQINDHSDSFWRDIFDDQGERPLPPAAYCHRDASGGDVKVIIYCSDVDAMRGPFSYAVGSNAMAISALDNLLCEANDHNGLSSTAPEARRKFAALPTRLRQKGSFGNDLEAGDPRAQAIVDSLWEITAPAGAMVAFDTKGIHRGGMVIEGERRVLTCVLG